MDFLVLFHPQHGRWTELLEADGWIIDIYLPCISTYLPTIYLTSENKQAVQQ